MSPNSDSIDVWNTILVPKFTRFRHIFNPLAEPHSRGPLGKLGLRAGDRVLDVGCGFGETTLDIARLVGESGTVLGFDCCDAMLQIGRADAARAGLGNVRFVAGDAQTHDLPPTFDVVFSRFGTMFFQSPKAAMKNLRTALVPGGRLLSVVWRTIDDNPCWNLPKKIVSTRLPPPPPNGKTCGPGPFSMADEDTVRAIMEGAGFADIRFERTDAESFLGSNLDEAIAFQLALGPAGEIVREAGDEGVQKRAEIEALLASKLEPYVTRDGVFMPSSTWALFATNPVTRTGAS